MQLKLNSKNLFIFLLVSSFIYLAYLLWNVKDPLDFEVELRDVISYAVLATEMGGRAVAKIYAENNLNIHQKGETDEGKAELLTKADLVSNHLMLKILRRLSLLKVISEEKAESLTDNEVDRYREDNYNLWQQLRPALEKLPSRRVRLKDLVVYIDPLDATQEFTEGLIEYVTVMACISIDGRPHFGVIYQPFSNKTVFGLVNYGLINAQGQIIDTSRPTTINGTSQRKIVVSRSHAGKVTDLANLAFSDEPAKFNVEPAGGAGYKTLRLIQRTAEIYLHTTAIKKWDICAGDAIIQTAGGALLNLQDGSALNYGKDTDHVHKGGILMALDSPYSIFSRLRKHLSIA